MIDLAAHADDEQAGAMAEIDDGRGHAQAGDEHRRPLLDDSWTWASRPPAWP